MVGPEQDELFHAPPFELEPWLLPFAAARGAGADEALFVRDDGLLTEGCTTTLFVERGGRLLTPPLALGLLPGVMRQALLSEGRAMEEPLTLADLADGFLLGNAVRGLMPARLRA